MKNAYTLSFENPAFMYLLFKKKFLGCVPNEELARQFFVHDSEQLDT